MPNGPQRPLSKRMGKKTPLNPTSRSTSQTGIVTDKRPVAMNTNLQRAQWNVDNRQTKGDWT